MAIPDHYPVPEIIVFGSRARGDHQSESDVDIAVILTGDSGDLMATKWTLADIAFDVMLDTGLRISPLPIWENEWTNPASYSNPVLLENIRREGIHCLKMIGACG